MRYPELKPLSKSTIERDANRKRALVVRKDIEKIIEMLSNATYDELVQLHRDLDGTYQGIIKNWGTSTYGYNKEYGYIYDHLDESSIRENLNGIKGKLRGYMLQLDPEAERIPLPNMPKPKESGEKMTTKQKKLLNDYGKMKEASIGNGAININAVDYPTLRDTLKYMEEYEYIRPLKIDGAPYYYIKEPSFEAFAEHILSQDDEEDTIMEKTFDNKKVFIVHGHDESLLNDVEMMLHRIGLQPIILKEQANGGRTIIEKIENYTDVGYGIILYTACDEGREKGTKDLNNRARQNVVFEHGYLCAKLGRNRVAAINDDGIEVPSDLSGVLYIAHSVPNWKQQLMREMENAGLEFDSLKA